MMNVDAARQLSRDIKEIFKRLDDLETNPVSITGGAVPAPVAQGDMLAADAVPAWSILSHPGAAGYALTTDGTDPLWDQTPAWTGLHNFEAGLEIADDQPLNLGDGADAIGTFVSASNYVAWTGVDWRFDVGVGIERDPLSPLHVQSDNNALTDLRDPSNYHVAITNPALDTGEMAALGFYISNEDDDVGGVIGFVRTDLHTKGELRFYTKQSNIDNVAPVLAMTLQDDGDCQFEFDVNLVTGRGIIHADGVAAGQYLRADGTRYIPANIAAGDLPAHASTHENAGVDEINVAGLSGELADAQPVAVSKNSGAIVGTRSELNFIEGANVTLTIADDAGNDEVDITIAATGGVAAHAILDGVVHTDSAADAVTRGSLIVGNSTPLWDELVIGTAHQLLKVNAGGTDPAWASFDWDDISSAAAADMVHDHSAAGEGGQLDWDTVWSDAVHSHANAGEGGQLDWDNVWSDAVHNHSNNAEGGGLVVGTTDTDATAGSVFFAGVAGVIQEDNTNLFWDDTNNALGIRSNAPAASADALHVSWVAGDAALYTAYMGSSNASNDRNVLWCQSHSGNGIQGSTSSGTGIAGSSGSGTGTLGTSLTGTGMIAQLTGAGTAIFKCMDGATDVFTVDDGGNVCVGSLAAPDSLLHVYQATGNTSVKIESGDDSNSALNFESNAVIKAAIGYRAASNELRLAHSEAGVTVGTLQVVIKEGDVGIGVTSPSEHLHVRGSGAQRLEVEASDGSAAVYKMTNTEGSFGIYTDSDELRFYDYTDTSIRALMDGDGNWIIGNSSSPAAQLHVDQSSTTAAIPVLYLDQADVSEEMIEFNSTIGVGNAIEAVGGKTLTTTHFIKVTLPGALTRYIPVGTIA